MQKMDKKWTTAMVLLVQQIMLGRMYFMSSAMSLVNEQICNPTADAPLPGS